MEDENTASVSQLDLLLKSEGSKKDHCFAVGILAIQKPCNLSLAEEHPDDVGRVSMFSDAAFRCFCYP